MREIFRMQLGQILGGRMKWLMVLCLAMPVLLTFAAVSAGGINELQSEIEGEQNWQALKQGVLPEASTRVIWEGEDLSFLDDRIVLERSGPVWDGRRFSRDGLLIANRGYLIIKEGKLWIDPSKQERRRRTRFRNVNHWKLDTSAADEITITLQTISAIYLFLLYPQVISLLLAMFYGTSVLGHELDGKTLTYLFTRPLPRWKFVVGKYLAILTALSVPTSISLFVSWLILGAHGSVALFVSLLIATLGALAAYNAIFVLFGFLVPRRAMIVALLYGIVFEFILSFVPALVNEFTVTYYLRSIVVESLDLVVPEEISRIVGGASLPMALFALATIIVCTLGVASLLAARKEYVISDTA